MKRFVKRTLFVVIAIIMIFSMAACGSTPNPAASTAASAAVSTAVSTAASASESAVETLGPATYDFYCYYNDDNSKAQIDYSLAAAKKLVPGVDVNIIPIDSTDTNFTKMKALIAANDVPQIYNLKKVFVDAAVASGQCLDLASYADKVGFTANVAPSCKDVNVYDGKLVAFTQGTQGFAFLYYNKGIFAKCGIEQPPLVWDDFLADMKVIKSKGYIPIGIAGKDQWLYSIVLDMLASRYNPTCTLDVVSGKIKFTDPPYEQAAAKFQQLAQAGAFSSNVNLLDYGAAEADFLAGKSAILVNGAWAFNGYDAKFGNDFGYLFFPANDASQVEESKQIWIDGPVGPDGLAVNPKKFKTQAELDRAVQFCYDLAKSSCDYYAVNGNPITTIKTDLQPANGFTANMQQWIKDSGNIKVNSPIVQATLPTAIMPDFLALLQKLSTGTYDSKQFCDDVQKLMDSNK